MKIQFYCFLIIGVLLIGCSCSSVRQTKNIHFLGIDEKGDVSVSGSGNLNANLSDGSSPIHREFQFQAAYSPIKHIAVSTSTSFLVPIEKLSDSFNGYDVDVAVGTYKRFNYNVKKDNYGFEYFMFDAYLSYGQGQSFLSNVTLGQSRETYFNRYGLQLGLHYQNYTIGSTKQFFKLGFIYRPTLVEYTRLHLIGEIYYVDYIYTEQLRNNNTVFIHEFAFRAELGTPVFRIFINRSNSMQFGIGGYTDKSVQLGIILSLNKLAKKEAD